MEVIVLVAMRLLAACICAAGAAWIASSGKDGWGWSLFAAYILGCVSIETKNGRTTAD